MGSPHPASNLEEVIERLTAELFQLRQAFNEVTGVIRSCDEFDGLSPVGGAKALLSRYKEELAKNQRGVLCLKCMCKK